MTKSILLSIKSKWVAKILNGEKTIEIRKKFPKDYRGWVYIYCTKEKPRAILTDKGCVVANTLAVGGKSQYKCGYSLSGEVVARFWCDQVEYYEDVCYWSEENEKATCLNPTEFFDYLHNIKCHRACYFIHISNLEIFDEPEELSEFYLIKECKRCKTQCCCFNKGIPCMETLTKAPQNFCYVKSEE